MSEPLVSIIIPTYDRAGHVETAVASVLEQDHGRVEALVIDDGSRDETSAVLERLASREDPERLRILRHENVGQAATINRGLAQARGELLGYLSSDDYLYPHALSRLVTAAAEAPEADVFYGWYDIVDDADRVIDTIECMEHTFADALRWSLCMPGVGALMRRRCFERIGGWDERYRLCGDFEWWVRARQAPFVRVSEPLGAWREHAGSLTVASRGATYVMELLRILDEVYADEPVAPEVKAVEPEAYGAALILASQLTMRGYVPSEPPRFAIYDRIARHHSRNMASAERLELGHLRVAFDGAERAAQGARETIEQQQMTIATLKDAARDREATIAELELLAGVVRGRPMLVRMGRALTPPALRPHLGAAVHRIRSRA